MTDKDSASNKNSAPDEIDLDAILDQRRDATGQYDTTTFKFGGQSWTMKHPLLADDEWRDELEQLDTNEELARHHMGSEEFDKFVAAGGHSGLFVLALREVTRRESDMTREGRPTRRSASSGRKATRKR